MNRKLYWGLGILIAILICTMFVFLTLRNQAEIRQIEADLEVAKKKVEEFNAKNQGQPIAVVGPPPAEPGFKWVRHGDHWDTVPISEQHQQSTKEMPISMYDGSLTYHHKELLETHPVEALRQLASEKGHWSAEFIPPFPPDDQEAAKLAKAVYIVAHHWTTVAHPKHSHVHTHSAYYVQANQLIDAHRKAYTEWTSAKNKARWEGRYKEFYDPDDLARWNDLNSLLYSTTLSDRASLIPLSEMRSWSSMFNDIRY